MKRSMLIALCAFGLASAPIAPTVAHAARLPVTRTTELASGWRELWKALLPGLFPPEASRWHNAATYAKAGKR